jgi:hypothetical protein
MGRFVRSELGLPGLMRAIVIVANAVGLVQAMRAHQGKLARF